MPSLVCSHLSFAWPSGQIVLDDLNASFPAGRTGLVGRNGVGKSTLLRILAGELRPTSGSFSGPGTVGYLPQQLVLDRSRTVADVLGIEQTVAALSRIDAGAGNASDFELVGDRWDIEERSTAALGDFGLSDVGFDRTITGLSGGQVILLALASLFLSAKEVLILDEPTNNLDRHARSLLYAAVQGWRGPVVMVSHDRELRSSSRLRREPSGRPRATCTGSSAIWPRRGSSSTGASGSPAVRPTTYPRAWPGRRSGLPRSRPASCALDTRPTWPKPGSSCRRRRSGCATTT
jgi:ABC-type Mn2+/Zn2+ transport system ATPase subunit